jgi:hypothetical protein
VPRPAERRRPWELPALLPLSSPEQVRAFFGGAVTVTAGPAELPAPAADGPLPAPAEPSAEAQAIWAAVARKDD